MPSVTQYCGYSLCDNRATQSCSGCKKTYYCSREHQIIDWREGRHAVLCQKIQAEYRKFIKERGADSLLELAAKLGQERSITLGGIERTGEDLEIMAMILSNNIKLFEEENLDPELLLGGPSLRGQEDLKFFLAINSKNFSDILGSI